MKNLLRISLIALTFTLIGTANAKIMKRRTVPGKTVHVTKNEKQMFMDTKALKNASSPQEKAAAAAKLAADIKNNPNAQLELKEQVLLAEIKELQENIANEESYISYFDAEQVQEDKATLEERYKDLAGVQTQLKKAITTRPQAVSYLNHWSVKTLVGIIGLALADQLVLGGAGRTALMSGANAAGGKISSAASTAWGYVPSWRSTSSTDIPSTPTETTGGFMSNAKWLAGAAGGLAASIALAQAKQYAIQKAIGTLMDYILGAEENPETVDPVALEKAKNELEELKKQNKELEKQITSMKAQQRSQK